MLLELSPSAYVTLGKLVLLLPFAFLFLDLLFLLLAPPVPLSGPSPAGGLEDDEVVALEVALEQRRDDEACRGRLCKPDVSVYS